MQSHIHTIACINNIVRSKVLVFLHTLIQYNRLKNKEGSSPTIQMWLIHFPADQPQQSFSASVLNKEGIGDVLYKIEMPLSLSCTRSLSYTTANPSVHLHPPYSVSCPVHTQTWTGRLQIAAYSGNRIILMPLHIVTRQTYHRRRCACPVIESLCAKPTPPIMEQSWIT